MEFMQFEKKLPIEVSNNIFLNNFTFDGEFYYFTIHNCKEILVLNRSLALINNYETLRVYDCICYDPIDCCFWASSKSSSNKIFKLSNNFVEIDYLPICTDIEYQGNVNSVSFNCCSNSIIISGNTFVVNLKKDCDTRKVICNFPTGLITCVLSLCPGYVIARREGDENEIIIVNEEGCIISTWEMPSNYYFKNIVYNPCYCSEENNVIYYDILAFKKGCYPYIIKKPVCVCQLGYEPCECNNYICCNSSNPNPNPNSNGGDPYGDIITSIALVETALSNILNAEGEKIQNAIADCNNIDDILAVNKEVNKTIINVTHLEQTLYNKLACLCEQPSSTETQQQGSCNELNNLCQSSVGGNIIL